MSDRDGSDSSETLLARVREVERMCEDLRHTISRSVHDINNALTVVASYLTMALDEIVEPAVREDLAEAADAVRRAAETARTLRASTRLAGTEPEPGEPASGDGVSILVVDDEPLVREPARRILVAHGYEVTDVDLPSEALRLCGEAGRRIDLLLTDVIGREMTGWELVARAREIRPQLKVLFMSGSGPAETERCRAEGSPFVEKPFGPKELLTAVGGALGEAS